MQSCWFSEGSQSSKGIGLGVLINSVKNKEVGIGIQNGISSIQTNNIYYSDVKSSSQS